MLPYVDGDRNRFAQQFHASPAALRPIGRGPLHGPERPMATAMIDRIVPTSPGKVLDVASGTAGVALQLARRTSVECCWCGSDRGHAGTGRQNVSKAGFERKVQLVAGRAEQLPFPDEAFDALTFTYLLRYVDDPQATLRELARVVKPGGAVASLEFFVPPSRFWHFWWWLYTRLLLPAGGWATGGQRVVRSGTVSRSQHLAALPQVPAVVDGGCVAWSRIREHWCACHESRGRSGDVGDPQR